MGDPGAARGETGPRLRGVFPSALYNQDRKLADQKAPGFYLAEMRPGFVQVTIEKGQMKLQYKPVGVAEAAEKTCPLPQLKS